MRADEHAIFQRDAVEERRVVLNLASVTYDDPMIDIDVLSEHTLRAHDGVLPNLDMVPDLGPGADPRVRRHVCCRVRHVSAHPGASYPSGRVELNLDRLHRLAVRALETFSLDLTGLRVLTEAASGPYVVTPLLAAMAGGSVLALTRDSRYGSADEVKRNTLDLARLWGVSLEVVTDRRSEYFSSADIVTNLGFVRPIDRAAVEALPPTAVIALMFEPWEFRSEDLDLPACIDRGILVLGTDEARPELRIFDYVGMLGVKLALELGIELVRSEVVILGSGPFSGAIARASHRAGAAVDVFDPAAADPRKVLAILARADILMLADHLSERELIGKAGILTVDQLQRANSGLVVAHIIGRVDVPELERSVLRIAPATRAAAKHMSVATDFVGPRPVVDLHAAGLKVGQEMAGARRLGLTGRRAIEHVLARAPARPLSTQQMRRSRRAVEA